MDFLWETEHGFIEETKYIDHKTLYPPQWAIKIYQYHINVPSLMRRDAISVIPTSNTTISDLDSPVVLMKEY